MKIIHSLIMCALILAAGSLVSAQTPTTPEETSATVAFMVNGEPLPTFEIQFAMQAVAAQMQQRGGEVKQDQLIGIATEEAIKNRLLLQEARRRDIQPDPAGVARAIQQLTQKAGGDEALQEGLKNIGVTLEQFEASFSDSQMIQDLVEKHIVSTVSVSEEEVLAFYNENQSSFVRPEMVHARHILFSADDKTTPEQREAAKANAEKARLRALTGEDFATLAKELSEGPSASTGGDLGFFAAEQMVTPFSKAAFALEPGGISEIVETRFGYHVIKVEERQAAGTSPLKEAGPQIRAFLEQRAVAQAVSELSEKLMAEAKVEPVGNLAPTPPDAE